MSFPGAFKQMTINFYGFTLDSLAVDLTSPPIIIFNVDFMTRDDNLLLSMQMTSERLAKCEIQSSVRLISAII